MTVSTKHKVFNYAIHSNTMQNKDSVSADFDSVFIKKVTKSRKSVVRK